MEIFVKDLKVGDKVNCHEKGWLRVTEIRNGWMVCVTYENGMEIHYRKEERLFVIR